MVSVTPTRTSGASPDTKNPLGSAPLRIGWRVAMGPLNPEPHDGCGRAGAGGGAKASVHEWQKTPAKSPDKLSATQKCTTAASQRGADAHPTDVI